MVMSPKQSKLKWPQGTSKAMKKMPDGNPYPYEIPDMAEGGISEPEVSDRVRPEQKYTPKPQANVGDDGLGGHQ